MTYRGHMQNGVAVLDTPSNLPDGTPVRVEIEHQQTGFWQNKDLDALLREQATRPLQDIVELEGDWPTEDSIDDFLSWLRSVRS